MIVIDQYILSAIVTFALFIAYRLGLKSAVQKYDTQRIERIVDHTVDKLCDEGYVVYKKHDDGEVELIQLPEWILEKEDLTFIKK
ncbi:MAG: hypothetical protein CMA53_02765 [Euryarchaeota archaeon]|nr:hypothetical protein [Euryarchaeota archaeon]|tara:strand:- start:1559 stop:1813 length:255 start_codon:yes stop_codon:yes gene_type:complete